MIIVTTNHKPRDLQAAAEFPEEELITFGLDYIEGEDRHSPRIFRYRGDLYDANEFTALSGWAVSGFRDILPGSWDGVQTDSYFSGLLLRWADPDFETVVIGRYVC